MTAEHQTGITAEASSDATFILLNAIAGMEEPLRQALSTITKAVQAKQSSFPEAELHVAAGFSIHSFKRITGQDAPLDLAPFPSIQGEDMLVKDEAFDICLHIRSQRRDVTHEMAMDLYRLLAPYVVLKEQTDCFKYLDNRDFTGFVDGTENPQGDHRCAVALTQEPTSPHHLGSYLNYMKFTHKLSEWEQLSTKSQEDIYGRTKEANEEYPSEQKSLHAHTKRTSLKDKDGKSLEILRQSMPFGDLKEQGLVFASYSKSPTPFNLMLESMLTGDQSGHTDHLMKYTSASTGSTFFVPSVRFLNSL